jgi:hypothetical protein
MAYPAPVNYYSLLQPTIDQMSDMAMAANPPRNNASVASGQIAQPRAVGKLLSGASAGGAGLDATGKMALGLAGAEMGLSALQMSQQGLDLGQIDPLQFSASGQPLLNSGYRNRAAAAKPQGASAGELGGAAVKGFAAGMQTGNPLVAGAMAVGNLALTAIAGGARKRKQRRERNEALAASARQQNEFNAADTAFDQTNIAKQGYLDRQNMTNRIYNLYSV